MPTIAVPGTTAMRGSVARRLIASFLVVAAVAVGIGVFGLFQLSSLNSRASDIYTKGAVPAEAVKSLEALYYQASYEQTVGGLPTLTPAEAKQVTALGNQLFSQLDTEIANVLKLDISDATRQAVQTAAKEIATVNAAVVDYGKAAAAKDVAKMTAAGNTITTAQADVGKQLAAGVKSQLQDAATQASDARGTYSSARTLIIIAIILGIGVSISLGLLAARSVIRPLRRTVDVLDRLAVGDLTARVEVTGSDELAQMGTSLNSSLESVGNVVRTITESARNLASASGGLTQVAHTITEAADTAAGQAASVARSAEDVSANVATVEAGTGEMAASIREIAINASQASAVAADAMTVAEETTLTMTKLGDSSAEIGNVINVITAIAAQTNLLALNATIEAARAGDAGKGFAVVASEVKELAQGTARATEDIGRRVAAIQSDTTGAVEAINRITSVIDRVHGFQATIAAAVEEQNATTTEMGRNVGQAASTSADIAQGIAGVAASTQASSTGAKASMDAANELSALSAQLREAVSHFTV